MKHWLEVLRLRALPLALCIYLVCVLSCDTAPVGVPVSEAHLADRSLDSIMPQADAVKQLLPDAVNQTDEHGQKQGRWINELNGKPWKEENYVDGKLHGRCSEHWANGDVIVSHCVKGTKHGAFIHYNRTPVLRLCIPCVSTANTCG